MISAAFGVSNWSDGCLIVYTKRTDIDCRVGHRRSLHGAVRDLVGREVATNRHRVLDLQRAQTEEHETVINPFSPGKCLSYFHDL